MLFIRAGQRPLRDLDGFQARGLACALCRRSFIVDGAPEKVPVGEGHYGELYACPPCAPAVRPTFASPGPVAPGVPRP